MYMRQSISLLVGLVVISVSNGQNLCQTPNSYQGQCISLYNCTGLFNFIKARRAIGLTWTERQFITQSQCFSNIGQHPHVCCNNDDPFLQTPATTPQPNPLPTGGGTILPDPSNHECGQQLFTDRILNGTETELGEFPWMVILEYQNSRGVRVFDCGGSLINSRYVLTVAHCLVGRIEQVRGQLISVRLGEHNTDMEQDCVTDRDTTICSDPIQDISVERKIPHSEYVPNDRNQLHDIGLVRLAKVVSYTEFIRPICLPSPNLRTAPGVEVIITGWGQTLTERRSSTKQKISLRVTDQQECRNKFSTIPIYSPQIEDTQLCAGGEANRDTCLGDSGGPLMISSGVLWYAEGLVSFGLGCGQKGWPGVYTRVSQYLDWISLNLEP